MLKRFKLIIPILIILILGACSKTNVDSGNNQTNYNVYFYVDNEVVATSQTTGKVTLYDGEELDINGYNFVGWYLDSDFNTKYTNTTIDKDTSLYAKFEPINYDINYTFSIGSKDITNDVTNPNPNSYTILDGESLLLKEPSLEGYQFVNWYYEGNYLNDNKLPLNLENISIEGVFEAIKYNISYELGLASYEDKNITSYSSEKVVTFKTPTMSGYTFMGWYLDSDYKTQVTSTLGLSGDITLYPKFEFGSYKINIIGLEGMIYDGPTEYNYLTADFYIPVPSIEGYTFMGYYSDQNYEELVSVDPIEVKKNSEGNITLYAKFVPIVMTYNKPTAIKLSSIGEEFNLVVKTFNNAKYTVEYQYSDTLKAGIVVDCTIIVTDEFGNVLSSDKIEDIKVYDKPTIIFNNNTYTFNSLYALKNSHIKAIDSFGEELEFSLSDLGDLKSNGKYHVVINAIDAALNEAVLELDLIYYPSSTSKVIELHYEDKLEDLLVIDEEDTTIPFNKDVYLYVTKKGKILAYSDGILIEELDEYNQIYAIKENEIAKYFTLIEKPADLALIEKHYTASYYLTNDIDMKDVPFEPFNSDNFSGNFYGNNHKISNLSYEFKLEKTSATIGLFGCSLGSIYDLTLENINFVISDYNTSSRADYNVYFGGLVGENRGIIKNVKVSGIIDGDKSKINSNVSFRISAGLVAGRNFNIIENVSSSGSVLGTVINSKYIAAAHSYIGGLVGYNNGTINNSYTTADVNGEASSQASYTTYDNSITLMHAGGFVGYMDNNSVISNCYASGNVSVKTTSYTSGQITINVGGFVGRADGKINSSADAPKINYCYASGNVEAYSKYTTTRVGGFVGHVYADIKFYRCFTISEASALYAGDDASFVAYNQTNGKYSPSYSYCYTADYNNKISSIIVVTKAELLTASFIGLNLGFSSTIWNILDGTCPTLKFFDLENEHIHVLSYHEASEGNCQIEGNIAHYECTFCHKLFKDEDAKEEVALNDVKTGLGEHSYIYYQKVEATCEEAGKEAYYICDYCDNIFDENKVETTEEELLIEPLGHDYQYSETIAPNFNEQIDGYDIYICSNDNSHLIYKNYVEWETLGITISFISEYSEHDSMFVEKGLENYNLPTPSYESHDFIAWYIDNNYNEEVTFPLTSNITLYAKWELKTLEITYVYSATLSDKDYIVYDRQKYKYGDEITLLGEPKDPNWEVTEKMIFNRWYCEGGESVEDGMIIQKDYILFAYYNTYTLSGIIYDEIKYIKLADANNLTPELFNAKLDDNANDDDKNIIKVKLFNNSSVIAGKTIDIYFEATNRGIKVSEALYDVLVLDTPSVTAPKEDIIVNETTISEALDLVSALDSTNESIDVIYEYPEFVIGDNVVNYQVIDLAGNVVEGSYNVYVYGLASFSCEEISNIKVDDNFYYLLEDLNFKATDCFNTNLEVDKSFRYLGYAKTSLEDTITLEKNESKYFYFEIREAGSYRFKTYCQDNFYLSIVNLDNQDVIIHNNKNNLNNTYSLDIGRYILDVSTLKGANIQEFSIYNVTGKFYEIYYELGDVVTDFSEYPGYDLNILATYSDESRKYYYLSDSVAVYGMPTITDSNITEITRDTIVDAELLEIVAADSYNVTLDISLEKVSESENTVTYRATATDVLNQTLTKDFVLNVYDKPILLETEIKNIRVNTKMEPATLGIKATDSFGKDISSSIELTYKTKEAGVDLIVRATAKDKLGQVVSRDYTFKVYDTPTVKTLHESYDLKLDTDLNQDILGIEIIDSYNMPLNIDINTTENVLAGREINYVVSAIDAANNEFETNIIIRYYDIPSYEIPKIGVNEDDEINKESLGIVVYDSFGLPVDFDLSFVSGEQIIGNIVIYKIEATDCVGNILDKNIEIKVYDPNGLKITNYNNSIKQINVDNPLRNFEVEAIDSFGEEPMIDIELTNGEKLNPGTVVDFYIIATDNAGNTVKSDLITNVSVFGDLSLKANFTENKVGMNEDFSKLVSFYDSFNVELTTYYEIEQDSYDLGDEINVKFYATDAIGNALNVNYVFSVERRCIYYVNDELYQIRWIGTNNLAPGNAPFLELDDPDFAGWLDENGNYVSYSNGKNLMSSTADDITVYAKFYEEISTVDELQNINLNGAYRLMNNLTLNSSFRPIGSLTSTAKENNFRGVIDFNNKEIKGLNFTNATDLVSGCMFTYNYGRIMNMKITKGKNTRFNSLAYINYGYIENISYNYGGIAYVENLSDASLDYFGAISYENYQTIEAAKVYLELTINDNLTSKSLYIGGIVAKNKGTINSSRVTGQITLNLSDTAYKTLYMGAIVGSNTKTITKTYSVCSLIISGSSPERTAHSLNVGGIAGTGGSLNYVYSQGDITIDVNNATGYPYTSYIGGIIGKTGNWISDIYYTGEISITNRLGHFYVGGLAGQAVYALRGYSTAKISVNLDDYTSTSGYVGGLFGEAKWGSSYKSDFNNLFFDGEITGNVFEYQNYIDDPLWASQSKEFYKGNSIFYSDSLVSVQGGTATSSSNFKDKYWQMDNITRNYASWRTYNGSYPTLEFNI